MTRTPSTLPPAQPTPAAAAARPAPTTAAPLMPPSLAMRAASLAGALLATTVLLGSQVSLAVGYSHDAQTRQLAARQAQVVAQHATKPAPAKGSQAPDQASLTAVF